MCAPAPAAAASHFLVFRSGGAAAAALHCQKVYFIMNSNKFVSPFFLFLYFINYFAFVVVAVCHSLTLESSAGKTKAGA